MFCLFVFFYGEGVVLFFFFFSSRRRHTSSLRDWSSDVCSSDLAATSPRARPGRAAAQDRGHWSVRRAGRRRLWSGKHYSCHQSSGYGADSAEAVNKVAVHVPELAGQVAVEGVEVLGDKRCL